jgi:hypothetical protein
MFDTGVILCLFNSGATGFWGMLLEMSLVLVTRVSMLLMATGVAGGNNLMFDGGLSGGTVGIFFVYRSLSFPIVSERAKNVVSMVLVMVDMN